MSRIDTTSSAEMYLRGASLGTQQFGLLADLAQQNLQNQRTATLDARADEQRGIDNARDVRNDAMSNWARVQGVKMSRSHLAIAQAEERRRVEDQKAQMAERERIAASRKMQAQTYGTTLLSQLDRQGEDARAQRGAEYAAKLGTPRAPTPMADVLGGGMQAEAAKADKTLSRMIRLAMDAGDVDSLELLSPNVDDQASRIAMFKRGQEIVKKIPPSQIADPRERALVELYVAAGQNDRALRMMENGVESRRRIDEKMQIDKNEAEIKGTKPAAEKKVNATGAAKIYADEAKRMATNKKSGSMSANETTRYNMLTAAAAAAQQGHVLPDGSVVLNGGRPKRVMEHKDGRVVGVEKYDVVRPGTFKWESLTPEELQAEMPADSAAQGQGVGAPTSDTGGDDYNTVVSQLRSEGKTPREIATELYRRGFRKAK